MSELLEKLVSTNEAAAALGLEPQTLAAYRSERRGPKYYKVGRRVLYDPSDVRDWLSTRRIDPVERAEHERDAAASETEAA